MIPFSIDEAAGAPRPRGGDGPKSKRFALELCMLRLAAAGSSRNSTRRLRSGGRVRSCAPLFSPPGPPAEPMVHLRSSAGHAIRSHVHRRLHRENKIPV